MCENEKNEVKELSKEEMEHVEGGKARHDFRVALPQDPQLGIPDYSTWQA